MTDAAATIIVAIITSGLGLAGIIITNHSANKKMADQVKTLVTHQEENRKANKKTAEQLEKLTDQVEKLEEHQRENYLGVLRLEIMNEEMPVTERIIAGETYLKMGGNGDVKKFYKAFLEEHTK